ncbi:MAG TPA: HEAT repeat domain-containing protein [Longimicrobiales bacterium]|nr:HEAT repeat domain-containing protein [Longimicrobiales bacterium]
MRAPVVVALLVLAAPQTGTTQSAARVAEAVRATPDGWIRFAYETRDGVEICPRGIRYGENRWLWSGRSRGRQAGALDCAPGPAEVELEVREGTVRRVELVLAQLAERAEPRDARDIGEVDAAEAAGYLLSLAQGGASSDAAQDALLPAFLADVPELWRDLARLACDRTLASDVRRSALFWLGQEAASAATAGIAAVAADEEEEQEVREAAVFALSQRPPEEGVPILMDLARSAQQAETRRAAFFWLAQAEDERVAPFFEEVLLRDPRE